LDEIAKPGDGIFLLCGIAGHVLSVLSASESVSQKIHPFTHSSYPLKHPINKDARASKVLKKLCRKALPQVPAFCA